MSQQRLDQLKEEMEKIRRALYEAFDRAMGNLDHPEVKKHAHRFDVLLTEYVHTARDADHKKP